MKGMEIVKEVERTHTDASDRPVQDVVITASGLV